MRKLIILIFLTLACTKNDLKVLKIMPYNKPSAAVPTSVRIQVYTSKVKDLDNFKSLAAENKLKILIYPDAGKIKTYNINLLGLSPDIESFLNKVKDDFPVQEIAK